MYVIIEVLLLTTIFKLNWAQLKSCDVEKGKPKICSKGQDGYTFPFPVKLKTYLDINQIVGIDEDEKSISIQMTFISNWNVSGLDRSDTTTR